MSDEVKLRRPVLPEHYDSPKKMAKVAKETKPTVESMMDSVNLILCQQIEKLRVKSYNYTLDKDEVANLRDYTRSLVELSKEQRERDKADEAAGLGDLKNLTMDQLLELANQKRQQK